MSDQVSKRSRVNRRQFVKGAAALGAMSGVGAFGLPFHAWAQGVPNEFDGSKFLKAVRKAYKDICVKEKRLDDGDSVPVRDILKKLGGRTDEQNVDLSKLARMNPQPSVKGKRIDFQQSKDTEKGMLLWKSTGGYIGFITFKAERKPEEQA